MNAVAVIPAYNPELPDFLKTPGLFASASGLTAGISSGQPPTIAFNGKAFKLRDADGSELFVQQMHLDVVVVGNNAHVSKTYYEGKYDPSNSGPPDCWSDNGVAPSSQCGTPFAPACATCPNNAFGSKINEATGAGVKACGDAKKLAVVLAAPVQCVSGGLQQKVEPYQEVYLLKLPAMSMRPWKDFATGIERKGWPVKAGLVIRLEFDPETSYPKVMFKPAGMPTAETFALYSKYIDGDLAREAVGADDVPLQGQPMVTVVMPQAPLPLAAPQAPAYTPLPIAAPAAAPASMTAPIPQATPAPAPTAARGPRRGRAAQAAPVAQPAPLAVAMPQMQVQQPVPVPFPVAAATNGAAIQTPGMTDPGIDARLTELFGAPN